jgi:hypothetical protein
MTPSESARAAGRVGGLSRSPAKLAAASAARVASAKARASRAKIRAQEDADYAWLKANGLLDVKRGQVVQ